MISFLGYTPSGLKVRLIKKVNSGKHFLLLWNIVTITTPSARRLDDGERVFINKPSLSSLVLCMLSFALNRIVCQAYKYSWELIRIFCLSSFCIGHRSVLARRTMTFCILNIYIIHSKYFPDSDWLKAHVQFTITSYWWPNLEEFCV